MDILDAQKIDTFRGAPSFTLRNRLYRLSWTLVWTAFGIWTPRPLHGWRRLLLRAFGAKIASSAKIYPGAKIWSPATFAMGECSCVGPDAIIYSMAQITLEPFALISQGAHLCAGTHDIDDAHFQLQARPITIGARAWIAAEAFVGPGVTIHEGAVLGARACAFRDIEAWSVYVGNPARYIRPRRSPLATTQAREDRT